MEPSVIAICLIAFLVAVVVTRIIFSIPTIVANSKAQTKLLIKIAEKSGVAENNIKPILRDLKLRIDAQGNVIDNE